MDGEYYFCNGKNKDCEKHNCYINGGECRCTTDERYMMPEQEMLKYRVIEFHKQLVKSGQYIAAKKVLRFLNKGEIILGMSDIDWMLEKKLDELGCESAVSRRYYTVRIRLKTA